MSSVASWNALPLLLSYEAHVGHLSVQLVICHMSLPEKTMKELTTNHSKF